MKEGSRIFNRVIKKRYFASYLDRGRDMREWRWLRKEGRKGFSLQEVLTVNNTPADIILKTLDRCIEIEKIEDKKTERGYTGNTKPKQ